MAGYLFFLRAEEQINVLKKVARKQFVFGLGCLIF